MTEGTMSTPIFYRLVLEASLWNGSLNLITARLSESRINSGIELEEDFHKLIKDQAEAFGKGHLETAAQIFGCTHVWIWAHIEKMYHVTGASIDVEDGHGVEKEVETLEELLGHEMKGESVLELVKEMLQYYLRA